MFSNKVRRIIIKTQSLERIIFGTSSLGSRISFSESIKLLKNIYSLGIRNIDTGPLYGSCQAHTIINQAFKKEDEVKVYSKFLSKIINRNRFLAKLIFLRCGIRSYMNFFDSGVLYKKLVQNKFSKKDIEFFIKKQKKFYPNINFKGWFIHSPSSVINYNLSNEKSIFNDFGFSGSLDLYQSKKFNTFIQTNVENLYKEDLKLIKAKKIFVNRIYSYSAKNNIPIKEIYKELLEMDERIYLVIGTTKIKTMQEIINNII